MPTDENSAWSTDVITSRPVVAAAWFRCAAGHGVSRRSSTSSARHICLIDGVNAWLQDSEDVPADRAVVLLADPSISTLVSLARKTPAAVICERDEPHSLSDALEHVLRGDLYLSPLIAEACLRSLLVTPTSIGVLLSSREREVLKAIVAGATGKSIARQLGIAPKTVEAHRTRLFSKLGVRNQREAVARVVLEPGLLE